MAAEPQIVPADDRRGGNAASAQSAGAPARAHEGQSAPQHRQAVAGSPRRSAAGRPQPAAGIGARPRHRGRPLAATGRRRRCTGMGAAKRSRGGTSADCSVRLIARRIRTPHTRRLSAPALTGRAPASSQPGEQAAQPGAGGDIDGRTVDRTLERSGNPICTPTWAGPSDGQCADNTRCRMVRCVHRHVPDPHWQPPGGRSACRTVALRIVADSVRRICLHRLRASRHSRRGHPRDRGPAAISTRDRRPGGSLCRRPADGGTRHWFPGHGARPRPFRQLIPPSDRGARRERAAQLGDLAVGLPRSTRISRQPGPNPCS